MEELKITSMHSQSSMLRDLYKTAFPANEQIPWDVLMRLIDQMSLDFTAYYDAGEFVGFTIVYPRPTFNWYWYFAVREELRGKGIGQKILSQLIRKYEGQPCVQNICESPFSYPFPCHFSANFCAAAACCLSVFIRQLMFYNIGAKLRKKMHSILFFGKNTSLYLHFWKENILNLRNFVSLHR